MFQYFSIDIDRINDIKQKSMKIDNHKNDSDQFLSIFNYLLID